MNYELKAATSWQSDDREEKYLLGKVMIAFIYYDGATSKGDNKKYACKSNMYGIKAYLGHFETEEEAKKKAESVADFWIKKYLNTGHETN